jgi:hypothetical protein
MARSAWYPEVFGGKYNKGNMTCQMLPFETEPMLCYTGVAFVSGVN